MTKFQKSGNVLDLPRSERPKKIKTPSKQEIIKNLNEKHSTSRETVIKMNLSLSWKWHVKKPAKQIFL